MLKSTLVGLVALTVCSWARPVSAQLGDDGEPIDNSNYTVDASRGPITGSTRVVGLGGAYVAIAEGAEGTAKNPASVAVRLPYSRRTWDYATAVDFGFGGWLPETDYLNESNRAGDSDVRQDSLLFGSLAANVYYRLHGFGVAAEASRQALERENARAGLAPTSLTANYGVLHASVAHGFYDGQVVVGAGPRFTGWSLNGNNSGSDLISVAGVGSRVGTVVKPHGSPWRAGLVAKSAVNPRSEGGAREVSDGGDTVWRPESIRLPWEVDFGFAYQLGPRPLNTRFVSVESRAQEILRELERNVADTEQRLVRAQEAYAAQPTRENQRRVAELQAQLLSSQTLLEQAEQRAEVTLKQEYHGRPRSYFLISTELVIIGGSSNSVSVGSVVSGVVQRSRDSVALSPRLGVETEVLPERLKLRAGSYLEPSRSDFSNLRVHGTFGFDLKLFHWNVFGALDEFDGWSVSTAVDAAKNYLNTTFSLLFWH